MIDRNVPQSPEIITILLTSSSEEVFYITLLHSGLQTRTYLRIESKRNKVINININQERLKLWYLVTIVSYLLQL